MINQHKTVNLARVVMDGQARYQVKCACGRRTEVGSRKQVEQEQKAHRKQERNKHGI